LHDLNYFSFILFIYQIYLFYSPSFSLSSSFISSLASKILTFLYSPRAGAGAGTGAGTELAANTGNGTGTGLASRNGTGAGAGAGARTGIF
jgi:hypothetical protein